MTTDDETSKTSTNQKEEEIRRSDEGKRSKKQSNSQWGKTRVTVSVALPSWTALKEEGRYRCGSLSLGLVSLGQELQIACLLVIRFENNERDRFVLWGPKKHTTNITAYRHRCHQREQNETSFFWMWCSSVWCLYTMCVLTFTTIFLINFCECH